MKFEYRFRRVCTRKVEFELDDNLVLSNVRFYNGCPGNTEGVAKLSNGRKVDEIIPLLKGTVCESRRTSCPDQFAIALEDAVDKVKENKMAGTSYNSY